MFHLFRYFLSVVDLPKKVTGYSRTQISSLGSFVDDTNYSRGEV